MKGKMENQVRFVMREYLERFGESRHEAKSEAREEILSEGGSPTMQAVNERMGIHSWNTFDDYKEKLNELATYARETDGVRDLAKLEASTVEKFLADKIEAGVSLSHFNGYCAAVSKLQQGLEAHAEKYGYDRTYNFRENNNEAIKSLRVEARASLEHNTENRAYTDPQGLIDRLSGDYQLAAALQYEGGLRVAETSITAEQLRGMGTDRCTGAAVGLIDFDGKGGKANTATVSPETYSRLEAHIATQGTFSINANSYREALGKAATSTNQAYTGSHGLRWSYAQERYAELTSNRGYSDLEARQVVSSELGHNRIEITNLYLGKS